MRFTPPASFFACLLTLAASLAVFFLRSPAPSAQVGAVPSPERSAISAEDPGTPINLSEAVPAAHAAPRLPSESLQAILPTLEAAVDDWRAFAPDSLVIQLDDGLRVPFHVTGVESYDSRTVLTARLTRAHDGQHLLDGAFLVATAVAADRWDAIVILPEMEYHLRVRGGFATRERATDTMLTCGAEVAPHAASTPGAALPTSTATTTATGPTVDVLFLFNAEALVERNHDRLAIEADCSNYIAASNAVLANSRVDTFSWRYVGAEAAPSYATTANTLDDLRAMRDNGAIASFVHERQRTRGADQVVMLVGGRKADAVGRAWVGGPVAHSVVSYPYPAYGEGFRSSSVTSYSTVCHEMAHNFGCNHQRDDASTEARDGDGKYHYAHVAKGKYGLNGTIMAAYLNHTNLTRVPYFSNADVSFEGSALGVESTQPRAASNARILVENAPRLAGLHQPPAPPTIVEHPTSLTVTAGEDAAFTVRASGEGLSYAWHRNGCPLSGSPGTDRLMLAGVGTDAAGDYTVTVSNAHGSTTSFGAKLIVNARTLTPSSPAETDLRVVGNDTPPSSPIPAPSKNAGSDAATGSGGGSLAATFALAFGALFVARIVSGRLRAGLGVL